MLNVESLNLYTSKKILDLKKAASLIEKLKKEGKKVGLCHGGFDLLHPGHIKHFESAKRLCDILFVSITSDKFVGSRKGEGRPVYTDKLRAYSIASIEYVDYVIIANFKTAIEVINLLKPSFYIKGPDFIDKTTPGITTEREAIKKVGGGMKYTDDPKLSTTEIIDYIKSKIGDKSILMGIDRDGTIVKNDDFLGKNKNWEEEINFNDDLINFLSCLQRKFKTIKIVLTNQAGVARRFFDCKRVEEINKYIESKLSSRGVKIDNWQYCPFVDSVYASKHPEFNLDKKYIKDKTKRKPFADMLLDGLKELGKDIDEFNRIIIIGNGKEDKELAKNLNAKFVDVEDKKYEDLLKEIDF